MVLSLEGKEGEVQELLDAGYSFNKISQMMGVTDKTVKKITVRKNLEIYKAFDEEQDSRQLVMNFEWLYEEDMLDEICEKAFNGENAILSDDLGPYVRREYGDIFNYLRKYEASVLADDIKKACKICGEEKPISEFYKHKNLNFGLDYKCKSCHDSKMLPFRRFQSLKRRAMEYALPHTITKEQMGVITERFNGCALTDLPYSIEWEHAIPISMGHGGNVFGNLCLMVKFLNTSKYNHNIFDWFEGNRQRFNLSQAKFDSLIDWLASANNLTVQEYRDFVYWCHENPRTIDEIKADQRHSIEIWRQESGQQFPLPAYAETYTLASTSEIEATS